MATDTQPERNHDGEELSCQNLATALHEWLKQSGYQVEEVGETAHGGVIFGVQAEDGTPISLSINVTP